MVEISYTPFRQLVEEKSGILLPDYRVIDLKRVVDEIAQAVGCPDLYTLHRQLASGQEPQLTQRLIEAMTIGETYFFRNEPQFRLLERMILPDIVQRRSSTHTLHIWSAACATGEEPYSIAALLCQLLPDIARWNVQILGTDINQAALEKARKGVYREWSMRQTSSEARSRYFLSENDTYRIRPEIQRLVTFQTDNLLDEQPPLLAGRRVEFDLILCRNVLIYFSEQTGRQVIRRLRVSTDEQGWLLVGHSEPAHLLAGIFRPYSLEGTTVYRPEPRVAPPLQHPAFPASAVLPSALPALGIPLHTPNGARELATVIKTPPLLPPPLLAADLLALQLWDAGQVDQALGQLKRLSPKTLTDAETGFRIARIYARRTLWADALAWLDTTLGKNPLLAQAHYLQGIVYHEQGDNEKALAAFRKTLYADPNYVLAYVSQATVLEQMGENGRARKSLDNVGRWIGSRSDDEQVVAEENITVGGLRTLLDTRRQRASAKNGRL